MTAPDRTLVAALLQKFTWALCRLFLQVEVDGLHRLPLNGPIVVIFNHLSVADGPLVASILPRKGVFLVAREFDRIPVLAWWIRKLADPIYIDRDVPDRRAVVRARGVLEDGGLLCVAPEGRVSPTGALSEAHEGAAFLAKAASARLVPFAVHGQEKFWRQWLRLRRPCVRIVVGDPFRLPHDRAAENTSFLMRRIAELLPDRYQGFYRTAAERKV